MRKTAKASHRLVKRKKPVRPSTPRFHARQVDLNPAEGLCMNCSLRSRCMYFAEAARPVMACEEFYCGEPALPSVAKPPAKGARRPPNPLLGLCATCENAVGCMYAAAENGRWHCEEYR